MKKSTQSIIGGVLILLVEADPLSAQSYQFRNSDGSYGGQTVSNGSGGYRIINSNGSFGGGINPNQSGGYSITAPTGQYQGQINSGYGSGYRN